MGTSGPDPLSRASPTILSEPEPRDPRGSGPDRTITPVGSADRAAFDQDGRSASTFGSSLEYGGRGPAIATDRIGPEPDRGDPDVPADVPDPEGNEVDVAPWPDFVER
jgi:hypothetical protein